MYVSLLFVLTFCVIACCSCLFVGGCVFTYLFLWFEWFSVCARFVSIVSRVLCVCFVCVVVCGVLLLMLCLLVCVLVVFVACVCLCWLWCAFVSGFVCWYVCLSYVCSVGGMFVSLCDCGVVFVLCWFVVFCVCCVCVCFLCVVVIVCMCV